MARARRRAEGATPEGNEAGRDQAIEEPESRGDEEPEAAQPAEEPETGLETAPEEAQPTPEGKAQPAAAKGPARARRAAPPKARATKPKSEKAGAERAAKKPRAVAKRASGAKKPIVRTSRPEHVRGAPKERRGVVVSNAMDKTIVVRVETVKPHPRYKKVVRRSKRFHAHDERNEARVGDIVRIAETRPLSRTKSWRLVEIVEAAQ